MGEFELIQRYFSTLTAATQGVVLGIGDDAAVLALSPGEQLVATVDTSNADVHFPADADAFSIGYRALAVNLSDLAAMGAQPRWITLSLTLPSIDESWLAQFAQGLAQLANAHAVALVGGDTTRGTLAVSIQALGAVPANRMLTRSGAQPGDLVYVTGSIGDAAAGLACYQSPHEFSVSNTEREFLVSRYLRPTPRVALGSALRDIATSCIDISDGLVADVGHIAKRSGVGISIAVDLLPASAALLALPAARRRRYQLGGGDDYELCFTVPSAHSPEIEALAAKLAVRVTCIGEVSVGMGVACVDATGAVVTIEHAGFAHF